MKELTGKMQRQVSKMGSAAAKVKGTLEKEMKMWKRKVADNEEMLKNTIKSLERVLDPKMMIEFKEKVIPEPVMDETTLACNPE